MMNKKSPHSLAASGRPAEQKQRGNIVSNIIPQAPPSFQQHKVNKSTAEHALAQAAAGRDWRLWWAIYCQIHGLPSRPTGLDVKRALMRKELTG